MYIQKLLMKETIFEVTYYYFFNSDSFVLLDTLYFSSKTISCTHELFLHYVTPGKNIE